MLMLLKHVSEVRNLGDVKWVAIEDATAHKGTGRHIAMFVLTPANQSLEPTGRDSAAQFNR